MQYWRRASRTRDGIVWAVIYSLVITPFLATLGPVYADEVIDEANKGQDTGANLLLNYTPPTVNNGPPLAPIGPNELPAQDLFPGFNPADPTQLDAFKDLFGNPSDLSTQGVAESFSLGTGTGQTAEAYQAIDAGSVNPNAATIDMRTETFLDRSRDIIAGTDPILDEILTACAEDVTAGTPGTDTVTRLEDIWTCSQLRVNRSGTCTVERNFSLVPVATQTILAVIAGGVCEGVTGNDLSDWDAIDPIFSPYNGTPAPVCLQVNGSPTIDWHVRNFSVGPPGINFFYFANFCGEFDTAVPTAQECTESARMLEHACRNAGGVGNNWFLNSNVGPTGSCASYSAGALGGYDGTIPVDYTGCDADRINYCQSVASQFEGECGGSVCQGATCGSGQDLSDWTAETGGGALAGPAPAPLCMGISGSTGWADWIVAENGGPFTSNQYFTRFCGEFDTQVPTPSECSLTGGRLEHACRNADTVVSGGYVVNTTHPTAGPAGSCASYSYQLFTAYDGTAPVDYTGCDQARVNFCQSARADFEAECAGDAACQNCTPGGNDLSDWQALYGAAIQQGTAAAAEYCHSSGSMNITGAPSNDWYIAFYEPTLSGIYDFHFGTFCGEFDTAIPTAAECTTTANQLEQACSAIGASQDGWYGNPSHPTAGPIGSCLPEFGPGTRGIGGYADTPVTWGSIACDADRQNYCQAFKADFLAECNNAPVCTGGCVAEDNIAIYNVASYYDNTGPVRACRTNRIVFNYATPPGVSALGGPPKDFSFMIRELIDPGDYDLRGWSTDVCGNADAATSCTTQGQAFEDACNNVSGGWPVVDPSGNTPTPAYCAAERATFEANCAIANQCFGPPGVPLLNGTETIVSPGIGPGFLEILADQNVFGSTVDFQETAFNPGDYGLAAGEYVITDHTVSGNGLMSSNIDDHGSYGSNWDFTSTLTLSNSDGFTVDATLYEIVTNGFTFNGCTQADVANVENGVCTGAITCTDYTPPCRTVDGVMFCESIHPTDGISEVLSPWTDFTTAVPEMCWFATVDIVDCVGETNCIGNPACVNDCADLPVELQPACLADPCWVDAQGNTICLDTTSESWVDNLGDLNFVDDCNDLLGRPECSLLPDITCVEGMESDVDPTNLDLCNLRTRYFDCGSDVTVPGVPGADDVDVTCGAEVRCFGDECSSTTTESNPDFVRAAVAATTATESTKDMQCDILGDPTSCKIFEGTDSRCKDPRGSYLGIIPDCCKMAREAGASAGDFVTYMQLARHSFRLARDPMVAAWLAQRNLYPSALENVVNAPSNIGRTAGRAVVNGFNSALEWAGFSPIEIATEAESVGTSVGSSATGFGPIQQFIAGGVDNFLRSIGADTFADSLFTTSTDGAVTGWAENGLGEMVGNVIAVIGFIYTVYSVLKILGSIIFACEEEELAFGIQMVNRACHHVGTYCAKKVSFLGLSKCVIEMQTYCCFSTPFARIINEQLRLQGIGGDWGTATEPNCEGISITELENVDWSLVDLSEWEAIMFEAGLVPDPRNPPMNFVPSDRHPGDATGGATGGNEGATSTDINQEIIDMMMDDMDQGRFDLEGAPLNQPDPELMPWYDDGGP